MNKDYTSVCIFLNKPKNYFLEDSKGKRYKQIFALAKTIWIKQGKPIGKDYIIWTEARATLLLDAEMDKRLALPYT